MRSTNNEANIKASKINDVKEEINIAEVNAKLKELRKEDAILSDEIDKILQELEEDFNE